MNEKLAIFKIFLGLKVKEIFSIWPLAIMVVGFLSFYFLFDFALESPYFWICFIGIYVVFAFLAIGGLLVSFLVVYGFILWICSNWRQANEIYKHTKE